MSGVLLASSIGSLIGLSAIAVWRVHLSLSPKLPSGTQSTCLGSWPLFANQAALNGDPWGDYLSSVYGELPNSGYPLCTGDLWMLYDSALDVAKVIPPQLVGTCPRSPGHTEGEHYIVNNMFSPPGTSWIWHPYPYNAFASNTWIEVMRLEDPFGDEHYGAWFMYAKGSGIWFNSGATISFAEHSDAYTRFGVTAASHPNEEMCKLAAAAKFDSVQFRAHVDSVEYRQCDTSHNPNNVGLAYLNIEIVAVKLVGTYACGTNGGAPDVIRTGWQGSKACHCDNSKKFLNCAGIAPAAPTVRGPSVGRSSPKSGETPFDELAFHDAHGAITQICGARGQAHLGQITVCSGVACMAEGKIKQKTCFDLAHGEKLIQVKVQHDDEYIYGFMVETNTKRLSPWLGETKKGLKKATATWSAPAGTHLLGLYGIIGCGHGCIRQLGAIWGALDPPPPQVKMGPAVGGVLGERFDQLQYHDKDGDITKICGGGGDPHLGRLYICYGTQCVSEGNNNPKLTCDEYAPGEQFTKVEVVWDTDYIYALRITTTIKTSPWLGNEKVSKSIASWQTPAGARLFAFYGQAANSNIRGIGVYWGAR